MASSPQNSSDSSSDKSTQAQGKNKTPFVLESVRKQEHFIPVRYEVMIDKILERSPLTPEEKEEIRYLGLMFEEHYHFDYHRDFLKLKDAFAPFNPDRETIYEPEYTEEEKAQKRAILVKGIDEFLTVSNYCKFSDEDFNECLKIQPFGSLAVQVNTKMFKTFNVYCRGIRDVEVYDTIFWFFKRKRMTVQFCRIFVLAEYKTNPTAEEIKAAKKERKEIIYVPKEQEGAIIAKQFRDVPVEFLKIIVPETQLCLPLFDKIKITLTTLFGLATTAVKFVLAAAFSLILFAVLLFGVIMAIIKGVFGFFNSKTKCMQKFSESLYHKSLSNNVAAVSQLVNQAEAQEVKEALLAYYMLYVHRDKQLTMDELDKLVEAELQDTFGQYIDFEVDDALRKLFEKKLATVIPGENGEPDRYQLLLPIKAALQQLDEIWDGIHTVE